MPIFDIADLIVSRLGEPTVAALRRRFDPDGRCPTCSGRFGSGPLSVRAYYDGQEAVTLVAHHAACAHSAWLDVGAEVLSCIPTWTAETTAITLPLGRIRPLRWLVGAASRSQELPVMFVRPSLEMARVRQVFPGEAVSADVEQYCRLGFAELGELTARAHPLRPVCRAWLRPSGPDLRIAAMASGSPWLAPVAPEVADQIKDRGGIMIAVSCDRDPYRLSADPCYRERALGAGEVLLGWAQLSPPPGTG